MNCLDFSISGEIFWISLLRACTAHRILQVQAISNPYSTSFLLCPDFVLRNFAACFLCIESMRRFFTFLSHALVSSTIGSNKYVMHDIEQWALSFYVKFGHWLRIILLSEHCSILYGFVRAPPKSRHSVQGEFTLPTNWAMSSDYDNAQILKYIFKILTV